MILLELKNEYDHLLINRIVKNYKHIRKWAKRNCTDCFRIYDRDIPEYPLSADYYAGKFIFQYYSRDDGDEVPGDLGKIIGEGIGAVFGAPAQDIFWKVRKKRALLEQYEKLGEEEKFFACEENGKKFYINLGDYLDSGLFLDHRSVREIAERMSHGKRVLNLFSYTSSFTVYSVAGGATGSVSVDMSNTYTAWAEKNFRLNGIDMKKHLLIREDCLKYLRTSYEKGEKFDLVIIDPPTISRSKKMDGIFDVNTGHAGLIINCSNLLRSKESVMLFSTNSRKFRMDEELNLKFNIDDISQKTIPEGFRDKKIHKVFLVKLK